MDVPHKTEVKCGQTRIYPETLSCRVTVYFTPSQFDDLFGVIGTTGDASSFLRDLFLTHLSTTAPINNGLINLPACADNDTDG